MNEAMNEVAKNMTDRILPGLGYGIAILLVLAGPAAVAAGMALAYLTGEAVIIAAGLQAGALMGAVGAVAVLWCLKKTGRTAG